MLRLEHVRSSILIATFVISVAFLNSLSDQVSMSAFSFIVVSWFIVGVILMVRFEKLETTDENDV